MMWGENLRWDGFRDERGRYCTPEAFEARTGLITTGSHPGDIDMPNYAWLRQRVIDSGIFDELFPPEGRGRG